MSPRGSLLSRIGATLLATALLASCSNGGAEPKAQSPTDGVDPSSSDVRILDDCPELPCEGPLEPGKYRWTFHAPTIDFEIPTSGWIWHYAGGLLHIVTTDASTTYEGLYIPDGIYLLQDPAIASQDCAEKKEPGLGRSVADLVSWLEEAPGLDVSEPTPVTVGGLDGMQLDLRIDPAWERTCFYSQGLPVVPLIYNGAKLGGYNVSIVRGQSMRWSILDTDDGVMIVIRRRSRRPVAQRPAPDRRRHRGFVDDLVRVVMSARSQLRRRWIAITFLLAVLGLAACGTDNQTSAPSDRDDSVTSTTGPGDEPLPGRILFSRTMPSGELLHFVVGTDGSGEAPFVPEKEFEARSLSPDGSLLAIAAPNDQGLLVGGTVNVDGSGFRLFESVQPGLNLVCGVWAPEERLACEGWNDSAPSQAGIYTVRASDGSDPRRLTRHRDVPCEYGPDGTELAFIRIDPADDTAGHADAHGRDGRRGASVARRHRSHRIPCDWSPDGRSILTSSGGVLTVVTPDGESSPIIVDGMDGFAIGGLWSPDGLHILFSMSPEDDRFDVYTAAADGSGPHACRAFRDLLEESAYWLP